MNKHQVAFVNSAHRLWETTGHLYFWTFTFRDVYNAWEYAHIWHRFADDVKNAFSPYLLGLRVVEMHETHGFHYHCLFNSYLDARRMWRICRKHGIGHIDVRAISNKNPKDIEQAINYAAKYLTKDGSDKFPVRVRRWGSMFGFQACRVADLTLLSPYADSVSYLTKFWSRGSFGRDTINAIYNSPHTQFGDYRTLVCGIDYQQHKRLDSFNWRERRFESCLRHSPWRDWVTRNCTIYKPVWMPALISQSESLYWSKQKVENKSCTVATAVFYYRLSASNGIEQYEETNERQKIEVLPYRKGCRPIERQQLIC